MLTTDVLLIKLTENVSFLNDHLFPKKEKKILLSLSHQLKRGVLLTKKQANLLINILSSNKENFKNMSIEDLSLIENPVWNKEFREIVPIKKIYFSDSNFNDLMIESTHDKTFKDKINKLKKILSNNITSVSPTVYKVSYNEFILITVVNFFSKDDFAISNDVKNLYEKINDLVTNNSNYLNIYSPNNDKILNCVLKEVTDDSNKDLILLDRRIRYQYSFSSEKVEDTLKFKIANRSKSNVWIDESKYELEEILDAFNILNRFPCLFIFDKHNVENSLKILNLLKKYSDKQKNDNIGIYFRVDNSSPINKEFNEFIKNNDYNKQLNSETKIAGIANTMLPKFFFTVDWYPCSVINFSTSFNGLKSKVFCQGVDLIVNYAIPKPVSEKLYDIL